MMTSFGAAGFGLRDVLDVLKDARVMNPKVSVVPVPGKLIANAAFYALFMGVQEDAVRRVAEKHGVKPYVLGSTHYWDAETLWSKIEADHGGGQT